MEVTLGELELQALSGIISGVGVASEFMRRIGMISWMDVPSMAQGAEAPSQAHARRARGP